jgi:ribonuclease P protein component
VLPAVPRSERLARGATLRASADYRRCYREGTRRQGSLVTLHFRRRAEPAVPSAARLGMTASRKVGNAVVRNRLKRWTREFYRRWPGRDALPPADLIVHFKPAAGAASHGALARELEQLLGGLRGPRPR